MNFNSAGMSMMDSVFSREEKEREKICLFHLEKKKKKKKKKTSVSFLLF
jgi:hypothetical protein